MSSVADTIRNILTKFKVLAGMPEGAEVTKEHNYCTIMIPFKKENGPWLYLEINADKEDLNDSVKLEATSGRLIIDDNHDVSPEHVDLYPNDTVETVLIKIQNLEFPVVVDAEDLKKVMDMFAIQLERINNMTLKKNASWESESNLSS